MLTAHHRGRLGLDGPREGLWLAAESSPDATGPAASAPLAAPVFFAGWIGVGVVLALVLARRGHDRRLMLTLGIGLGPLMAIIAIDALRRREAATSPLVLAGGIDHGGDLDVLVLVEGGPDAVAALGPTLRAIARDVGTVTLARVVEYEWIEDDGPNPVVDDAVATLEAARDLLPFVPSLVLLPGRSEEVARRFGDRPGPSLVLIAVDEGAGRHPRR